MTNSYFTNEQLDQLGRALRGANNSEEAYGVYLQFVDAVRAAGAPQALQANGFPPTPLVPAPNVDFVQPISEDALQRREWNARFNPTPVDEPVDEPVDKPVGAEVTKAAP